MLDRYDHDLLLAYLEGELDADRCAALQAQLDDDPELAALLHAMAKDRAALRALPSEAVPAELSRDLTHALERRMLLDDSINDSSPIPIARGRGLPNQTIASRSWMRVASLSALAASVAIAAGVVVFMLPDPLEQTATRLADEPEAAEADAPSIDSSDLARADEPGADDAQLARDNRALRDNGPLQDNGPSTGRAAITNRLTADDEDPAIAATPAPNIDAGDQPLALGESQTPPVAAPPAPDALALRESIAEPAARAAAEPEQLTDPRDRGLTRASQAQVPAQRTVAIAAIQPRFQLNVYSEAPEVSYQRLVDHCITNGIPIVQTDTFFTAAPAQDAALPDEGDADTDADQPPNQSASVALLINQSQLDALVHDLNNDLAIASEPLAQQQSLLNNQAAYLSDMHQTALQRTAQPGAQAIGQSQSNQVAESRTLRVAEDKLAVADNFQKDSLQKQDQSAKADEPPLSDPPAAISLQLPADLGNPYANSRNRYNFTREQQRSVRMQGLVDPAAGDPLTRSNEQTPANELALAQPADAADADLAEQSEPANFAAQAASQVEQQKAQAAVQKQQDSKFVDRAIQTPGPASTNKRIDEIASDTRLDPQRTNWLTDHLPLTPTTLIFNKPAPQADPSPAQLVPIRIKQAPADKVQRVRADHGIKPQPAAVDPTDDTPPVRADEAGEESEAAAEAEAEKEPDQADQPDLIGD